MRNVFEVFMPKSSRNGIRFALQREKLKKKAKAMKMQHKNSTQYQILCNKNTENYGQKVGNVPAF
jgi:hypothetical protein